MITFNKVTLQNFMGYGNDITTVILNKPGTTLIVGEDLDHPSTGQSNGVGKTTIMNAFTYALYDRPIDDSATKDELVNNINKKNMEVTLEFSLNNGKEYKIIRSRKTKAGNAGNNVYLFEDGVDKTPDSIAATNALIESIIGIPYEVFVRIIVFSASHQPFLQLTTKAQSEIIEELFGLTSISRKAELLKTIIKDTENSMKLKQGKVESAKAEIARRDEQIEAARKRVHTWDAQRAQNIEKIKGQLQDLSDIDIQVQQELLDQHIKISEDLKTKRIELDKETTSLNNHIKMVKTKEKDKQTIAASITNANKEIKDQHDQQAHLRNATCPYCLQHFDDTQDKLLQSAKLVIKHQDNIQQLEAELLILANEIAEDGVAQKNMEDSIGIIKQHIANLDQQLKIIHREIVVSSAKELQQLEQQKSNLTRQAQDLEAASNPHQEALDELLISRIPEPDYTEINELANVIEHQKFLLKLLTKKDSFVRKTLLNKNIPFLNSKLQGYLTDLGLPHKVEFTKEMSASVSQFGRTLSFSLMSQGQRARINFALSLAFKDVLQSIHGQVNVFMLDEILDHGLDSVGIQAAARMIKRKARDEKLSMFVISHREEVGNIFDRKLVVQMQHGFSHIKETT